MVDQPSSKNKVLNRQRAFSWNLNMWEEWRKHVLGALEICAEDPDEDVREEAATAIARMQVPSDLAAALEVLGDTESPVPISTVFALGPLEEPAVAEAVLDAYCRSSDLKTAFAQLRGPKMFDAEGGHQVLIEALEGDDRERRRIAADFLSDIAPPAAEGALCRALEREPDSYSSIHRALGKIGTPTAVDVLIRSTTAFEQPFARTSAIAGLRRAGDRRALPCLLKLRGDANGAVRNLAETVLEELRDPTKSPLQAEDWSPPGLPLYEEETVEQLVEMHEEETDRDHGRFEEVSCIVSSLGDHPDPEAIDALIDAYSTAEEKLETAKGDLECGDFEEYETAQSRIDGEEEVCREIVEALGDRGDPSALEFIAGEACANRHSGPAMAATKVLDAFKGPDIVSRLISAQAGVEEDRRKMGIGVTLARRGHRESLELILTALNEEEASDVRDAVWALGQVFRDEPMLGDAEPLGRLQTALPKPREMTEWEREWKERARASKERNSGPLIFEPPEDFLARAQAYLDEHKKPLLEYRSDKYSHTLEVDSGEFGPYEFEEPSAFDPYDPRAIVDIGHAAWITLLGHGTETIFKHPTTGAELGRLTDRRTDGMLSGCDLFASSVDTLMAISCLQYFLDEEKESVRIVLR